jgi:hypothetical protein
LFKPSWKSSGFAGFCGSAGSGVVGDSVVFGAGVVWGLSVPQPVARHGTSSARQAIDRNGEKRRGIGGRGGEDLATA